MYDKHDWRILTQNSRTPTKTICSAHLLPYPRLIQMPDELFSFLVSLYGAAQLLPSLLFGPAKVWIHQESGVFQLSL